MPVTTTKKWLLVSAVAGVAVYYCEWLELISPGICNHGLGFTVARMYVVPILVSGVLGFFCFEIPLRCWLVFMLPSWIIRLVLFGSVGGNLWPLLLVVDAGHLLITSVVAGIVARLRQRARPEQRA